MKLSKLDRKHMRDTFNYRSTMIGLNMRAIGLEFCFAITPAGKKNLEKSRVNVKKEIEDLEKHPENIFFTIEQLRKLELKK